jgi:tRNA (guanine-N7-)-methyltransferase
MTSPRPAFQFYGRRKGKPLRRHHLDLMQNLMPQVSVDITEPLKGASDKRWLEIGFGGGEHMAHQAGLHPDVTVIGAEAFQNGVAKALAHIEEKALTNLRIHYGDARPLLEALPAESFDRVYLLYPDPWPKARQKGRRFVNAENLRRFHRILKSDGQFLFASDIADYVEWTREHVLAHSGFEPFTDSAAPFENWVETRFETKAKKAGRESRYLAWRKRGESCV